MKKTYLYIILIFVAVAVIALVITGSGRKKKLDERLSFRKNDKIPYGTVAFRSLSGMFPSAAICYQPEGAGALGGNFSRQQSAVFHGCYAPFYAGGI